MSDDSDTMAPRECLAIDSAAQTQVYAGSGVIAMRDQTLQEGDNFAHYAEQAVVLFPTAKQAGAFFTTLPNSGARASSTPTPRAIRSGRQGRYPTPTAS